MNKQQRYLEQMIALSLIAYVVGVWFGEAIRDVVYGKLDLLPAVTGSTPSSHPSMPTNIPSGYFILACLYCSNKSCGCPENRCRPLLWLLPPLLLLSSMEMSDLLSEPQGYILPSPLRLMYTDDEMHCTPE